MKWLEQQVSIEYSNLDRRAAYQSVINYLNNQQKALVSGSYTLNVTKPGDYKLDVKTDGSFWFGEV